MKFKWEVLNCSLKLCFTLLQFITRSIFLFLFVFRALPSRHIFENILIYKKYSYKKYSYNMG